ncbi:Ig-like domain-containing protein [Aquimarina sp. M1]
MRNLLSILLVVFSIVPKLCAQSSPNFIFQEDQIVIKKTGSTTASIKVYRGEISKDDLHHSTPIIGKTVITEKEVRFIPLIPFGWDEKYTVIYNKTIVYFSLPIPKNYEFLTVSKIYPSVTWLPANLLKWHIKFSKPVSTIQVYNYIQLVGATGDTLTRAILPLENVLVSEDGTVLTIWMEPGRQKRGLKPNQQLGEIFKNGESYHLLISREIKDNKGVPMKAGFNHNFKITTADRVKPNIDEWKINLPKINSLSNLTIKSTEPLDYGSCIDNVTVIDNQQLEVKGSWKLLDNETVLSFTPLEPWKKDNYQILFGPTIEDLAGNNFNRLFDNKIDHSSNQDTPVKDHKLTFLLK